MIIDKKHRDKISKLQKFIEANSDEEAKRFKEICEDVGIDVDSPEGDDLFDYIFNGTNYIVKFK